ncbi:ATP-binding cassette domain-containing protein [Lewinella sp. IMCC34191]|uniref:ABC transporter ATP-binding protein n=1 Tax=Lewinella sp. IMCC34191 TaxID=2259172 RepID=UPI0018E57794|nr:ATP-binding cassette domain-containing protein [Lewinella sp. IMCC34191]
MVVRNLTRSFGTMPVLRGVDLDLPAGTVHGIVGHNGAGKTTLFRCLAGLLDCRGDIQPRPAEVRTRIGFLPTDPSFPSYVTGWEYLKLCCAARQLPTEDFADQNLFDLPLDRYAEDYSTGMKKKLALFGLLVQQNDLYLLDEPFNGVDIQSNLLMQALLRRLRERGKTVLLSSHVFAGLRENCDAINVLRDGRIERTVSPDAYDSLEKELRDYVVGARLDRLRID